ncbi:hypothetical protein C9374_006024 [Naegleria lovaniensis]|uniref:histone acetyltransferase n=1 Tax=Naegleria lovaniensis TaxID=51637 RepID=A0AA88GK64_NAELO|nr:uncharacterized protein C9374_006024 [Naegleria lovaniensis]KAG2381640.1 hypothetical protein C9374_006024 [Naegleria lovaniensis]
MPKSLKQHSGNQNSKVQDPETGLQVGSKVYCLWARDNEYHQCEIVEIKLDVSPVQFYVHYIDFDRRLDEWVTAERFNLDEDDENIKRDSEDENKVERKLTRNMKRHYNEIHNISNDHDLDNDPVQAALEKEHEEFTKVKNIQRIQFGKYEIETWYFSPYPEEYSHIDKLYICEFSLKYMKNRRTYERHRDKCTTKHPPGDEIYRNGSLSFFEVDGEKQKIYCQNLCLLAKLFLDHKTLYFDVEPFLFYILCECDEEGCHMVGYFSKEKQSAEGNNLACILTLPPHQKKGYGKLLIGFSYELSKIEGKEGTPERPLSDLGKISYRSYWKHVLLDILQNPANKALSVKDIGKMTAIKYEDITATLQYLGLLKYWKGQHIIAANPKVIEEHLEKRKKKDEVTIDPSKIHWAPYPISNN